MSNIFLAGQVQEWANNPLPASTNPRQNSSRGRVGASCWQGPRGPCSGVYKEPSLRHRPSSPCWRGPETEGWWIIQLQYGPIIRQDEVKVLVYSVFLHSWFAKTLKAWCCTGTRWMLKTPSTAIGSLRHITRHLQNSCVVIAASFILRRQLKWRSSWRTRWRRKSSIEISSASKIVLIISVSQTCGRRRATHHSSGLWEGDARSDRWSVLDAPFQQPATGESCSARQQHHGGCLERTPQSHTERTSPSRCKEWAWEALGDSSFRRQRNGRPGGRRLRISTDGTRMMIASVAWACGTATGGAALEWFGALEVYQWGWGRSRVSGGAAVAKYSLFMGNAPSLCAWEPLIISNFQVFLHFKLIWSNNCRQNSEFWRHF